ncbi:MAG: type 4a pilus biogenesis protein PilO [Variovorax sp.]
MTFEELKQLDPNDPGRWPLPVRAGAIAIFFLVAAIALVWFGVWNRNKDELAQLETEENTLREEFKTKHGKAVNLDLYKQQLADIEQSFGAMLRQLPGRTEMPGLLNDISQAGNGVVDQQLFQKLPEVPKDFYAEQPINIRVAGNYHQLAEFISTVAALPRIVTLHDANVSVRQGGRADDLVMNVTARTYRYLDDAELAANSAAAQQATGGPRQ